MGAGKTSTRSAIDCASDVRTLRELHTEIASLLAGLGPRARMVVAEVSRWSIEQHLYHASLSADLAFSNVMALLEGKSPRIVQEGAPNELALLVFAAGGYPRGRSQAPRAVQPPERPEPELLAGELARNRESAAALEPRSSSIASATGRIPHRELGALSAAEWLHFARLHTAHHVAIVRDLAGRLPPAH